MGRQLQVPSCQLWQSLDDLCDPSFVPLFLQHGGIRTTLSSLEDYENDDVSGFLRIEAREIDTIGNTSLIDSIDPAFAPATGTPETGGWSTREFRTILRGLDGLRIVSADIVEVAPAYDTNAEVGLLRHLLVVRLSLGPHF
ncbi:hypothetical protein H0H93_008642 [Arthromyces matolae]|nr:hypothetical protein H0H93_008642 [Arthromyces matolae]